MIIREFLPSDHSAALKLWESAKGVCNCEKCSALNAKDKVEMYLLRNPGTSFVAVTDAGEVRGTVLAGHDGRTGLIYRLAVSDEYRKQGVAKRLVETAVAAIKREGLSNVKAFVLNENHGGNAFWEKIGFAAVDTAVTRSMDI